MSSAPTCMLQAVTATPPVLLRHAEQRLAAPVLVAGGARRWPIDYMLAVMRDETAETYRRLEIAAAAAPYMHDKLKAIEVR